MIRFIQRIFLCAIFFVCSGLFSQTFSGKVVGIKGGDTVVVLDSLNQQTTLRLAEFDCPEKKQAFGEKAKQFTSNEIYLKTIRYFVTDIDRYGRTIAMIYYDDDNKYLSEEIVKAGMGWQYKKYSKSIKLAELEETARQNKTGLWIEDNPVEPAVWRNTQTKK